MGVGRWCAASKCVHVCAPSVGVCVCVSVGVCVPCSPALVVLLLLCIWDPRVLADGVLP